MSEEEFPNSRDGYPPVESDARPAPRAELLQLEERPDTYRYAGQISPPRFLDLHAFEEQLEEEHAQNPNTGQLPRSLSADGIDGYFALPCASGTPDAARPLPDESFQRSEQPMPFHPPLAETVGELLHLATRALLLLCKSEKNPLIFALLASLQVNILALSATPTSLRQRQRHYLLATLSELLKHTAAIPRTNGVNDPIKMLCRIEELLLDLEL
jgi:hypothetical protein